MVRVQLTQWWDKKSRQPSPGERRRPRAEEAAALPKRMNAGQEAGAKTQRHLRVPEQEECQEGRNQQRQCEREVSPASMRESIRSGKSSLKRTGS